MIFKEFLKEKLKDKIENIEEIFQEAEKNKITVEEYLYRLGLLSDEFLELKSQFFNLPYKKFFLSDRIPSEVLNIISEDFSRERKVIAFDKQDNKVFIGIVDPESQSIDNILSYLKSYYANYEFNFYVISIKDFYFIHRQYRQLSEILFKKPVAIVKEPVK
jgi:hypothetical protein